MQRKDKYTFFFTVIVILIAVLFIWQLPALHGMLGGMLAKGAIPFWNVKYRAGEHTGGVGAYFQSKRLLADENERLREEVRMMEVAALHAEVVARENEELRHLLNGALNAPNRVLAPVFAGPGHSPYDMLVVGRGVDAGVAVGSMVYANDMVPLGRVERVFRNTSRVVLFSSPGERMDVVIGDGGVVAEAEGSGGGNFTIELPRGMPVAEGSAVSMRGTTDVLGVVEVVEASPADSFQTIRFKFPVNIFELRFVQIGL